MGYKSHIVVNFPMKTMSHMQKLPSSHKDVAMSLKQTIKTKICLVTMTPNYPLKEFVTWAESIDKYVLLHYLDDIQRELEEEQLLLDVANPTKEQHSYQILHSYWCLYCAQVRKYYRAIVKNPCCKLALSFLPRLDY